jgi:hypothetical protein
VTEASREAAIVHLLQTAAPGEEFDVRDVNLYGYNIVPDGPTGPTGTPFYILHERTGSIVETTVEAGTREEAIAQVVALAEPGEAAIVMDADEIPAWAVEEDGDTPDWVPDNAVIHIDLVGGSPQGRAWVEGTGAVAVDTLLGSDANTETGWGESTSYDPEKLTADGYVQGFAAFALIGAARTALLAGATVRAQTKHLVTFDEGQPALNIAIVSADGNDAIEFNLNYNNAQVSSRGGSLSETVDSVSNVGVGAMNALSLTFTETRAEFAVNGFDAEAGVIETADRPPGNPLVAVAVDTNENVAYQIITLYDPLPSTAGLSELSETGVTNTAPTISSVEWGAEASDPTSTSATYPSGFFDDVEPEGGGINIGQIIFADAEGNPLSVEMTDDDGGNFRISITNYILVLAPLSDGDYNFTVRATDPGGLYVEQEFTITVTA